MIDKDDLLLTSKKMQKKLLRSMYVNMHFSSSLQNRFQFHVWPFICVWYLFTCSL